MHRFFWDCTFHTHTKGHQRSSGSWGCEDVFEACTCRKQHSPITMRRMSRLTQGAFGELTEHVTCWHETALCCRPCELFAALLHVLAASASSSSDGRPRRRAGAGAVDQLAPQRLLRRHARVLRARTHANTHLRRRLGRCVCVSCACFEVGLGQSGWRERLESE